MNISMKIIPSIVSFGSFGLCMKLGQFHASHISVLERDGCRRRRDGPSLFQTGMFEIECTMALWKGFHEIEQDFLPQLIL